MSQWRRRNAVSWDYGFFLPKSNIFRNPSASGDGESPMETVTETPFVSCFACGQPLGVVSRLVYDVDEKPYCAECYRQILLDVRTEKAGVKTRQAQEILVV
jgi:hypothetical protein